MNYKITKGNLSTVLSEDKIIEYINDLTEFSNRPIVRDFHTAKKILEEDFGWTVTEEI